MAEYQCNINKFLNSEYTSCSICCGFYGLNYNRPVCSTCHMFLFPPDINVHEDIAYTEKADSGDSGNEEPNVETDFYTAAGRRGAPNGSHRIPALPSHKTDGLNERINLLSHPRDYGIEKVPEGLVDSLPTEVLLGLFNYLDDISLFIAREVCPRWRHILDGEVTQEQWKRFIGLRWPLFQPQYEVKCWTMVYAKLLESSTCMYCLEGMMLQSAQPIEESSWRHRRLRSELKTLRADPLEGIRAIPLEKHCCHWQASITGPQGSPYEGGIFFIYLQIPTSYPMKPPVVRFITKIFHPNISRHGDVGLDSIHHNWSLALTISKVLISIQSLLTDPYWYVCMEPAIGELYQFRREEFNTIARLWTWKYAMHDYLMTSSSSSVLTKHDCSHR